jgi:hypothetical protein
MRHTMTLAVSAIVGDPERVMTQPAYRLWRTGEGRLVAVVYPTRRGWKTTRTRDTYPTRSAAAKAALAHVDVYARP